MKQTLRTQQKVTAYIAENYNTRPFEWLTPSRFVDCHGCDGYVFKNERAARRYVLSDIHEFGSFCEGSTSNEDWVCMLVGIGMKEHDARRMVKAGQWDKVARRMLDHYGPAYFLSTYSGSVATLDDCRLLYY